MKQRSVDYTPAAARALEAMYDLIAEASSAVIAFGYEQRRRAFCDDQHAAIQARYLALGWEVQEDGP